MKIAFATLYDPQDVRRGSGTYYHLSKEIERQGHVLHYIGPLSIRFPLMTRLLRHISRRFGWRYRSYQDPFTGRIIGKIVTQKLNELNYDILLTNDYVIAGFTQTSKPVVLYTDAIFPSDYSTNTHPWLGHLSPINVWFCQYVTRKAIQKASLCLFPAFSALDKLLTYEGVKTEKTGVIPFGANLEDPTNQIAKGRTFKKVINRGLISLLFIGKDWQLKGGDVAIDTITELHRRGINAELHVVGSFPPYPVNPNHIHVHGLLDKTNEDDCIQLNMLFKQCDLLILPSVAEGFGIVFAEAAAYGLPSLAYNTTGVATAVRNGESGILLELGQSATAFADVIESWFKNPSMYDDLVLLSRRHFEKTVNWKTAVSRLLSEIEKILSNNSRELSFGKLNSLNKNGLIIND